MIAPRMLTVSDLFYRLSGRKSADKVHLLLKLYDCYKALNPNAESLDDFIFWGDVLLSDFDDVDKYLVSPSQLFTNVAQLKGMQDDLSYLTDTQREAMERFLSHFASEGRIKTEFRKIWDLLLPLYNSFREALDSEGLSYEGQVYRDVAERLDVEAAVDIIGSAFPGTKRVIFVGLNALNECEKKLMRRLRDSSLAEFCWDYPGQLLSAQGNKAGYFLSKFVTEFPPAFHLEEEGPLPDIRVVSVPSGVGQAKQIPSLLREVSPDAVPGIETAIVLPDETLLIPVLNSIPSEIGELNVTMGYPCISSSFYSLLRDVAALQMHLRVKDGAVLYYHKQVWAIFSNGVFKSLLDDEGRQKVSSVRSGAKYYIPSEDLSGHPLFDIVFRYWGEDVRGIEECQQQLCVGIAQMLSGNSEMALELDFVKEFYQAVGRLKTCELPVRRETYFRLLDRIVSLVSIPFRGEPLRGLQIMGPLETRALDFDNIIVLSCNEGSFPRQSVSASFVPPQLRGAFGLPTYEDQDAVWAYYFYRMIRRARTVTLVYDTRTEMSRSGEESRYIKQLELHFGIKVKRLCATSPLRPVCSEDAIPKTDRDIRHLREEGHLSASSLQNYLSCPAMFYYGTVVGLREQEEVNESLDAGMVGSVFHETMQELYSGRRSIGAQYLESLVRDRQLVRSCVRRHILDKLKCLEVTGRNIIYEDMVCRYVERVLRADMELLDKSGVPSFTVFALEKKCTARISGFNFVGYIDRLDSFAPGELRVVDYKTGKVTDQDFLIDDDNAAKVVSALFGDDDADRPKIALQLYLYDLFARSLDCARGRSIVNSVYSTSRLFVHEVESVAVCPSFASLMQESLDSLLSQIADTSIPWERRREEKKCLYCKFKRICGQ